MDVLVEFEKLKEEIKRLDETEGKIIQGMDHKENRKYIKNFYSNKENKEAKNLYYFLEEISPIYMRERDIREYGSFNVFMDHEGERFEEIHIKDTHSDEMRLKTAFHELTHYILHNDFDKKSEYKKEEIEAETVATLVSNYFHVDTTPYSIRYLYQVANEETLSIMDKSREIIIRTANKIINWIEEETKKMNSKPSIGVLMSKSFA